MRIHRIALRNYRGVAEREITFEASGVTIIEGDNETGKSSIAEAINVLFEEHDDTTKAGVKAITPVGSTEGAEVEADVSTGPYRFVYAKRWHRSTYTKLDVLEPRREQMDGRQAHDRVKAILAETVDEALWRALRVSQNAGAEQPAWGVDSSLGRALDIAAGGATAGTEAGDLYARVREARDEYWTATGRPTADRTGRDAALAAAESAVAGATAALRAMDEDVAQCERLARDLVELRPDRGEQAIEQERLEGEWRLIEERRAKVGELSAIAGTADAALARADEAVSARRALTDEVDRRRVAHERAEEDQRRGEPALEAAGSTVEQAEDRLKEERAKLPVAEAASERAAADHRHLRNLFDLETLTERHRYVVEAEEQISAADDLLAECLVDDAVLASIDAAQTKVTRKQAALDASAGMFRAEALRDVTLRFGEEHLTLREGETSECPIAGELDLVVGDAAHITVIPGADARALGSELAAAREDLARLCRTAKVADLADARRQHRDRDTAEQARRTAVQRRDENLRDLTLGEITGKVSRLQASIADYDRIRPDDTPLPGDISAAQRISEDAAAGLSDVQGEMHRCAQLLATAKDRYQEMRLGQGGLAERCAVSQQELQSACKRLEDDRGRESDDALAQAAEDAGRAAKAAKDLYEEAASSLAEEDPAAQKILLDNKRSALQRIDRTIKDREDELKDAQVRLEVRGEEGLQRDLDEATTRQVALARERAGVEERAAATRLLYDTMTRHRDAAKQRYVAPFRERIETLAKLVFGADLEVDLDDNLRIVRRTLNGKTLDWGQLSVGAQEQLAIIARLACSAIVSDDEGVPVIFDDTLGNTDPGRLERMGAVLAVASADSQVVVLTCTPDRYRHVGNATVIRIVE